VEEYIHPFLTAAVDGGEWMSSYADCFTPRRKPQLFTEEGTRWAPEVPPPPPAKNTRDSFDPIKVHNYLKIVLEYTVKRTEKEGKCMCNVTLRCVRAAIVAVVQQWALHIPWVCVCSLWYPARNAHAPHCHLWPTRPYNIFPHNLLKGAILGTKNYFNTKCVLKFSTNFVWNISHSKKIWARYDKKCILELSR